MNRFKEQRIRHGFASQRELAEALDVNQTAVSQWERGATTPNRTQMQKLTTLYGVSVDYLLGGEGENTVKGVLIPVLGVVPAGIPIEAIEDILDYEEISHAMAAQGEHFALRIKGASMEPRMREGDVVIVRKQEDADSGDTVVVIVNGDEGLLKKLKKNQDGIMLISTNPVYDPIYYSNKQVRDLPVCVIGKVVELRAKY